MGTVALMMDDSPVVIVSSEKANSANGMPELSTPTKKIARQRARRAGHWPRHSSSGSRNRAPRLTRSVAVATGPKSATARRMNMKDEPQIAPSATNCASHPAP